MSDLRNIAMAGPGRRIRTLPTDLNKVCPDEGDGYPVYPRSYYDLDVVPNLRRSNSAFSKNKKRAHFNSGANEKVS